MNLVSKTNNQRIKRILGHLIGYSEHDSDFVYSAGCHEVFKELRRFSDQDWIDLRTDIIDWNNDIVEIFIDCIVYGVQEYDLKETSELIHERSAILAYIFFIKRDFDIRSEIIKHTNIFPLGTKNSLAALTSIKHWILKMESTSEYNVSESQKTSIDQAIEKANC